MEWHIVTGEYPPQRGGVSDYTYLLVEALARCSRTVHVWAPECEGSEPKLRRVHVHRLPRGFSLRWVRALDRGLAQRPLQAPVIVQYVPHGYGWKSMNVLFCLWLLTQRGRNLCVMFHEVAFPLRAGQPWKHNLLAVVHRLMAWIVLHSAKNSFTSTEHYQRLLAAISPSMRVGLLRIFSNVDFADDLRATRMLDAPGDEHKTVGVFSRFGREICGALEKVLPPILENSAIRVNCIGPASSFVKNFTDEFPQFAGRVHTTGWISARDAGPHLQRCDVLLQLLPGGMVATHGTFVAALASGVPVVTTAGPLTEPLLMTGGVAFADDEPNAIRVAVSRLLDDPSISRAVGIAGRRLYLDHFDLKVTIDALITRLSRTRLGP